MAACPCGREVPFRKCCGPVIAGKRAPTSPEDLVRARYSAFVRNDMDYLVRSHHPRTVCRFDVDTNRSWAKENEWLGLEIVASTVAQDGGNAKVEFVATYRSGGMLRRHHEISEIRKDGGTWYFVDGVPAGTGTA